MAAKPPQKFALDFGSDDDSDGGVELKINEDYAKRFEHNKKREEKQWLEEKYKKNKRKRSSDSDSDSERQHDSGNSDSDDESSSEDEDEFGQLADDVADEDILATIEAIRSKDPRVYDGQTKFFNASSEDEDGESGQAKKKDEKPMFLKDYHRINLLSGRNPAEDEETDEKPRTYLEEQERLKRDLVRDMHNAADDIAKNSDDNDDDDDDDGFLKKKSTPTRENIAAPPNPETADPENPDEYLKSFLASKAWLPKDRKNVYGPAMESDDSEEEEIAEEFEQGFNLRFEDPAKAAQLVGHARGAVRAMTARKDTMSSRKRAREIKKLKKEEERKEREVEKGRLRALKVEELMGKVKQIKEIAGLGDADEDSWKELLKGGFSEDKWDELMAKQFGDDYYGVEEKELPDKPVWEDDVDIGDIDMNDEDEAAGDDDVGDDDVGDDDAGESGSKSKRKTRKDYEKEKREKKKQDRETRKEIEKFVDQNLDLDNELTTGKAPSGRFRYREVTPETFGLTPLDILAADDAHLNEFAGLKRYAAFRPKERKKQDKKKYSKKRNLREWRKVVFGNEDGPVLPVVDIKQAESTKKRASEAEEKLMARLDGGDQEKKKKRRKRR